VRSAALLVALFTIVVGIGGLISPESGTEIRRLYFATPVRLYTAGAVRVAMGLVVILSAAASRAPKTLRALGAVMCMQGLAATLGLIRFDDRSARRTESKASRRSESTMHVDPVSVFRLSGARPAY
jgi:hypothetical protein